MSPAARQPLSTLRPGAALLLGVTLLLGATPLLALTAAAATRIELQDGWRFRTDPQGEGEAAGWQRNPPGGTEAITIPHTWNRGRNAHYEGTAWYFRSFALAPALRGRHVELHFGATFYRSQVWVNGTRVGAHEGGYSEYWFDITPYLRARNTLSVAIDNTPGPDTIPGRPQAEGSTERIYDWWPYGGIVRGVWLSAGDTALLRRQHIDTVVTAGGADIHDSVRIENHDGAARPLTVTAEVIAPDGGEPVARAQASVQAAPGAQDVALALALKSVQRWDIDNPVLYTLRVTLADADGAELDSLEDEFGVRTIAIQGRRLLLNGRPVRLTGLARHEESPWEGLAETAGTILHDFDDMKQLQTTLSRPVHYQQHPLIYRYADHAGILMIPEIPMWQFGEDQMKNPQVVALAHRMLTEMIDQNYNHPSIFAWSMDNESATDTPGGVEYFRGMYALAKQLDPARLVSCADDRIALGADPRTNASSLADFVMWNEYFGTWDAPESLLPAALDRVGRDYPGKMVVISEFGVPGIFAANRAAADEFRIETIRRHLALYAQRDWIAGAILWSYEDYRSYHNLRPLQDDEYVDHGLVDKDRQRKPSYYVWQHENEPAHVTLAWTYDAKGRPDGFSAGVARRGPAEIPSYELLGYRVEWRVVETTGKPVASGRQVFADIGAAQSLSTHWSAPQTQDLHLQFVLLRPTDFPAVTRSLNWHAPVAGAWSGSEGGN